MIERADEYFEALDILKSIIKEMGVNMQEKRRAKRFPANLELEISQLFRQDNVKADVSAPIEVVDVSKLGIGFKSKAVLPLDYYFNAKLELGGKDKVLFCVVKIIRIDSDGERNIYGCEFLGMAPIFDYIFDDYAKSLEEKMD